MVLEIEYRQQDTTFTMVDGQARQISVSELRLSLPVLDVNESDVLARAEEEAGKPFNLAEGPLLRTTLLRRCAVGSTGTVMALS